MDIQEIIQEMSSDRKKLAGCAAALAIIFIIDIFFIAGAQVRSIQKQGKSIAGLKRDIVNFKKDLTARTAENARMEQEDFELYSQEGIPLLLNDVSKFARNSEVQIVQISASEEGQKPAAKKGKPPVQQSQKKAPSYVKVDVKAGYHELGRFLSELENWRHPLYADEIKIARNPENELKHLVALKLRTYVKK